MRKTVYALLGGSAAFALAACTPADAPEADDSMAAEEPAETETADAMTEEGAGTERDENGNPISPGAPVDSMEAMEEEAAE